MKTLVGLLILFVILALIVYIVQDVEVRILIGSSKSPVEELSLKSSDLSNSTKQKIIEAWGDLTSD